LKPLRTCLDCLAALVSWLALDESLTAVQILGLALVAGGVVALEAGTSI
jgi:drug/metabolite transporter (DMT)-like permease